MRELYGSILFIFCILCALYILNKKENTFFSIFMFLFAFFSLVVGFGGRQ